MRRLLAALINKFWPINHGKEKIVREDEVEASSLPHPGLLDIVSSKLQFDRIPVASELAGPQDNCWSWQFTIVAG